MDKINRQRGYMAEDQSKVDILNRLSNNPKTVISMKAIQRAGLWSVAVGALLPLSIIAIALKGGNVFELILLSAISIYFVYSGFEMNKLHRKSLIIVLLSINLLLSLLLVSGLVPIVTFIMCIIALFKVGGYVAWFKKNGEKYQQIITHGDSSDNDNEKNIHMQYHKSEDFNSNVLLAVSLVLLVINIIFVGKMYIN